MLRQLRWRIVAAHMLVVVVGVAIILALAYLLTQVWVPQEVVVQLEALALAIERDGVTSAETAAAASDLLDAFGRSLFSAVGVAAVGASVAGWVSSLLLAREILRRIQELADSSRRIADGHYDERVDVPSSDELAQVAHNFNEMAAALETVEATRIALIGDVSHELRTPLTSLDGYLEGMLDGVFPTNDETLALMYQEVRRLRRLVDDLQMLSRVEAGQLSLELAPLDVVPLVQRVVAQLLPQATAQQLSLSAETPNSPVWVCADADRTAQILLNLLGNALRYTPEGGQIEVAVTKREHSAEIVVTDTGDGIAPEQLQMLFERFYRVDPSRTRGSGGSGIGLTISRHLAWAMGGEISAESEGVGKGSQFTLTLPLSVQKNPKGFGNPQG